MSRISEERETVISFDDNQEFASIWSASPLFQRKMKRLGVKPVKINQGVNSGEQSENYRISKKWIVIRKPRKFNLTEEQRKLLSDRMRSRFIH